MKRGWHLVIGGVAFFVYQNFLDSVNASLSYPWFFGIFLLAAGSVFPDIIEPAYTCHHRGFFHCRGVLCVTGMFFLLSALIVSVFSGFLNPVPVYLTSCFLLGYSFHLLADSVTPAGLPR